MNAIDTNVLVYAVDFNEPTKQAKAIDLLNRLSQPPTETVLLWQVVGEYLSCLRRWQSAGRVTDTLVEPYVNRMLAMYSLTLPTNHRVDIERLLGFCSQSSRKRDSRKEVVEDLLVEP